MICSCKKDDSNKNPSALQGTYNLMYVTAKTNSIITTSDGDKSVTISQYKTTNNQGVVTFAPSNYTSTNVSYSIQTVATNYSYEDGELLDSSSYPFTYQSPTINATGPYQVISADSIYFPKSGFYVGADGSGGSQNVPGGARYVLDGSTLTISQSAAKDSSFADSGIYYQLHDEAVASMVFQKQ